MNVQLNDEVEVTRSNTQTRSKRDPGHLGGGHGDGGVGLTVRPVILAIVFAMVGMSPCCHEIRTVPFAETAASTAWEISDD